MKVKFRVYFLILKSKFIPLVFYLTYQLVFWDLKNSFIFVCWVKASELLIYFFQENPCGTPVSQPYVQFTETALFLAFSWLQIFPSLICPTCGSKIYQQDKFWSCKALFLCLYFWNGFQLSLEIQECSCSYIVHLLPLSNSLGFLLSFGVVLCSRNKSCHVHLLASVPGRVGHSIYIWISLYLLPLSHTNRRTRMHAHTHTLLPFTSSDDCLRFDPPNPDTQSPWITMSGLSLIYCALTSVSHSCCQ